MAATAPVDEEKQAVELIFNRLTVIWNQEFDEKHLSNLNEPRNMVTLPSVRKEGINAIDIIFRGDEKKKQSLLEETYEKIVEAKRALFLSRFDVVPHNIIKFLNKAINDGDPAKMDTDAYGKPLKVSFEDKLNNQLKILFFIEKIQNEFDTQELGPKSNFAENLAKQHPEFTGEGGKKSSKRRPSKGRKQSKKRTR